MFLGKFKDKNTETMIKDFNLKAQPYEIKENLISAIGLVLPITTFCVTLISKVSVPLSVMLTVFSLLPSAVMMRYGVEHADYKHMNKVYKANDLYDKKEVELSDEELNKISKYSKENNIEFEKLQSKVKKMKALKIRRDARDISAYSYSEEMREV